MSVVSTVSRNRPCRISVVVGLNGFLSFLPRPEMHGSLPILPSSGYLGVFNALESLGGALLLANRYPRFGLVVLGAVIVKIVLSCLFFDPAAGIFGSVAAVLAAVLARGYRGGFAPILGATARPS